MKMIAQPVYEEQFSNNDIASTKSLLDEMKSVHRVAEAVDSIILPEIQDEQDDRDYGKFQVVILNNWNGEQNEISIPENYVVSKNSSTQAVDWIDVDYGACDESVNYSKEEQKEDADEDEVNEEDQEAARNLSWLLNFKVESLFRPLETKNEFNGFAGQEEERIHRKNCKCNECSEKIREGAGAPGAAISAGPSIQYKKPPFTYTELIEQALRERGELTVSGIYKWISQNFPYYRVDDDRWKNSVRHNLSINPHFSKGGKATKGAGHLWTVVTGEESSRCSWKRRRLEQFVSERRRREAASLDQHTHREAHDAASFIAGGHDEDAPLDDTSLYPRQQGWVTTQIISLEQTAEEILMGVKREVEVEYLPSIPPDEETERSCGSADSDFLNPVSKQEAVKESGLLSDEALAPYHDLHLSHPSTDFFSDEEMTLQYYELAIAASNQ